MAITNHGQTETGILTSCNKGVNLRVVQTHDIKQKL